MEMCKLITKELFFKSAAHRYIYILLYTDAVTRRKLLSITEEMYLDKRLATEWKNNIESIILQDKSFDNNILKQAALNNLNRLYINMVED